MIGSSAGSVTSSAYVAVKDDSVNIRAKNRTIAFFIKVPPILSSNTQDDIGGKSVTRVVSQILCKRLTGVKQG